MHVKNNKWEAKYLLDDYKDLFNLLTKNITELRKKMQVEFKNLVDVSPSSWDNEYMIEKRKVNLSEKKAIVTSRKKASGKKMRQPEF